MLGWSLYHGLLKPRSLNVVMRQPCGMSTKHIRTATVLNSFGVGRHNQDLSAQAIQFVDGVPINSLNGADEG